MAGIIHYMFDAACGTQRARVGDVVAGFNHFMLDACAKRVIRLLSRSSQAVARQSRHDGSVSAWGLGCAHVHGFRLVLHRLTDLPVLTTVTRSRLQTTPNKHPDIRDVLAPNPNTRPHSTPVHTPHDTDTRTYQYSTVKAAHWPWF